LPTVAQRLREWQQARSLAWSARYGREIERLVDKIIVPKLGKRILAETTREDWTELAATLRAKAPETATWIYTLASSFLTHAEAMGWIALNPLPRRGKGLIAPAVAPRERILSDAELARVWHAAARLKSPKTQAFIRLLIMTSAREDEVAKIAIGEADLLSKRWAIPSARTKNDRALTAPLHPLLADELRAIWPQTPTHGGYRLIGAIRGSGFSGFSKLKTRIDELSGVGGWVWHDLRRTARSGMARLGVDSRAAEAALNHVSDRPALVRIYDRYDYAAEALAALQTWQEYVAGLVADVGVAVA
jgi:integrase